MQGANSYSQNSIQGEWRVCVSWRAVSGEAPSPSVGSAWSHSSIVSSPSTPHPSLPWGPVTCLFLAFERGCRSLSGVLRDDTSFFTSLLGFSFPALSHCLVPSNCPFFHLHKIFILPYPIYPDLLISCNDWLGQGLLLSQTHTPAKLIN